MLNMKSRNWDDFGSDSILHPGHKVNEPHLLFDKIEDSAIEIQLAKLEASRPPVAATSSSTEAETEITALLPQKEECTYEDFSKMDIRTATVLEAERVPKTDKLLKLTINTGLDTRTIVSGIAEYYTPEEMVGKQICILANLAPRKIKGIESNGMILMAKEEGGKMRIVTPEERIGNGGTVN
jgi:methionyl-tRNA synthetase